MDEQFIDRVLRATGVVGALAGLCGWATAGPEWALAFLLAVTWSIANLWVLAYLLVMMFKKSRRTLVFFILFLKVPILYGLIVAYLWFVAWDYSALIAGITLPLIVMVLKAVGRVLTDSGHRDTTPKAAAKTDATPRSQD